ncbi:MAG: tyrosine--tRNA ligase, partial [Candidatus Peribacteraceae bacterium]|nr:tyrosine--tRNA ligase [Candidatus Peribacteraceae bacterium]
MKNNIDRILSRSVSKLIGGEGFRKKLETSPEKVVIKYGVDPTKPDLHLGHAVCLRKLREFQNLGCKIVFLIGDFTAMLGDPSGKDKTRPMIKGEEIGRNVDSYLKQIPKILVTKESEIKDKKIGGFEIVFNFDWYESIHDMVVSDFLEKTKSFITKRSQLIKRRNEIIGGVKIMDGQKVELKTVTMVNLFRTLSKITHGDLFARKTFRNRVNSQQEIFMHELLYPVLQGIDSLIIGQIFGSCDLEIGGTDQLVNMKIGQKIQRTSLPPQKEQAVMAIEILEGTDGKEKMSKSLNNYIGITSDSDSPADVFGKTMRIPDELVPRWVELCTDLDEVEFTNRLETENPRDLKIELARELVKIYHGKAAADQAEEEFTRLFAADSKNGRPDEIPEIQIEEGSWGIIELLNSAKLVTSKSDARRLIEGGGVRVNDQKVEKIDANFEVGKSELILQIG